MKNHGGALSKDWNVGHLLKSQEYMLLKKNQLIPLAEINSPVNLESKADNATKDKKPFSQFSSANSYKTKTEKMRENRNIFPRKII